MDLYLIRHAEALALGERGVTSDEERPLSERGEGQAQAAARFLNARGVTLDRLYSSPLLRTRQTAEHLLRVWARPELELKNCPALAPGGKPRKLNRFLLKQGGDRVGLVGHMPDLADFLGWLIGGKKAHIELAKAGIAYVQCGEAPGKRLGALRWLSVPQWYE